MKRTPMTIGGAEALRVELKRLKSHDRPTVIKAIAEARAHGDLSENAEYHAAREQQGFIEGRIQEIEGKLSTAEIIDPSTLPKDGRVVFGAMVDLEDQSTGARVRYQIVGEDEADLKAGRISVTSPIARALVAKFEGDVVEVAAPGAPGPTKSSPWNCRRERGSDLRVGNDQARLARMRAVQHGDVPMRCTRALAVRAARSSNRALRASRSAPRARTLMSS